MTTPSLLQALGLSISVWRPRIVGYLGLSTVDCSYLPRGQLIEDCLEFRVSSYSHTINSEIGFDTATITLEGEQEYIESWIADGLSRHIEVYSAQTGTVWEGFVNSYSANIGSVTKNSGPVLDVVNRCVVIYTPIDYSADPPAKGPPTETIAAENEDSQLKYGILEEVIQSGEATQAEAEQIRDTQLRDMAWPKDATSISVGTGATGSITLECVGYGYRLDTFISDIAIAGAVGISTKIRYALETDPNWLFPRNHDYIEDNAFLIAAISDDNKTAWNVIQECVAIGTATDQRTFFGVYEDRTVHYWTEPINILYRHRIADVLQAIDAHGGSVTIPPWDVRPGQWVFMPDFLAGYHPPPIDLRADPRVFLIESVTFTAPYQVELNGERYGSLPQLLAKKGLGGM
jgi:hypothetical protein